MEIETISHSRVAVLTPEIDRILDLRFALGKPQSASRTVLTRRDGHMNLVAPAACGGEGTTGALVAEGLALPGRAGLKPQMKGENVRSPVINTFAYNSLKRKSLP